MIGGSDEELEVVALALRVLERTYLDRGVDVPAAVLRCREQFRSDWNRLEPTIGPRGLRSGDGDGVGVAEPSASSLLLTIPEAAEVLRVSTRTVERMVADQKLPTVPIGSSKRILRDDLTEFVNNLRESA